MIVYALTWREKAKIHKQRQQNKHDPIAVGSRAPALREGVEGGQPAGWPRRWGGGLGGGNTLCSPFCVPTPSCGKATAACCRSLILNSTRKPHLKTLQSKKKKQKTLLSDLGSNTFLRPLTFIISFINYFKF